MESNIKYSLQIERLKEIEEEKKKLAEEKKKLDEEKKKLDEEQILIKEEILGAGKNQLVNKIAYHNT